MAAGVADASPALRAELRRVFTRIQGRLRRALSAMRSRKELRPGTDPRALARFTVASIQGGMLLAKTHRSIAPLREVLDHALRYLRSHARRP